MDCGLDVVTDPKYEFCFVKCVFRALLCRWDLVHGPTGGAPLSNTTLTCHGHVWWKHLGEIQANKGGMVGTRSRHCRSEKPIKYGVIKVKGPAPWVWEGEWLSANARVAQLLKFEWCAANVGVTSQKKP